MSEEHVKGGFEKAGGRIKEATGALIGDEELKSEGKVDQVKGAAHNAWGDVKDAAKDVMDRVRHSTDKTADAVDRERVEKDPLLP